jgi:hypothetical protein
MKYLMTLFLVITTVLTFGQKSVDFRLLYNSWTEGKIDQKGKVIQADINRGGWKSLHINPDTTVIFAGSLDCGFGHERHGMWTLNTVDTTVTFSFTKKVNYEKTPKTIYINETETYKIEKVTADELILTRIIDGKEWKIPFIKTKKQRQK